MLKKPHRKRIGDFWIDGKKLLEFSGLVHTVAVDVSFCLRNVPIQAFESYVGSEEKKQFLHVLSGTIFLNWNRELWPKLKPGKNRLLCLYFNKILQISLILTNLFFFKPNWVLMIKAQSQSSSCFLNTWALKWSLASLSLASLPPFHARKMVLQRPLKWFFPGESAALHSSEIVCREQTHRERLFLTQTASVAPPAPVLDKYNTEG